MVEQGAQIGDWLRAGLEQLAHSHPQRVVEVRGCGPHQGLKLAAGDGLIDGLIDKACGAIPLPLLREPKFIQKLITASVINALFDEHNLLCFHADNREILLVLSPPLVAGEAEVKQALDALDAVLQQGMLSLCLKFVKSKLFAKFMELRG